MAKEYKNIEEESLKACESSPWGGQWTEEKLDAFEKYVDASVKFLSCEPLIEDLGELNLLGIDWVIVGGESGTKARPMKPEWVVSIKKQVEEQGAAFFFKQWGTWGSDGIKRNKHANGKLLQGEIIQQMPKESTY